MTAAWHVAHVPTSVVSASSMWGSPWMLVEWPGWRFSRISSGHVSSRVAWTKTPARQWTLTTISVISTWRAFYLWKQCSLLKVPRRNQIELPWNFSMSGHSLWGSMGHSSFIKGSIRHVSLGFCCYLTAALLQSYICSEKGGRWDDCTWEGTDIPAVLQHRYVDAKLEVSGKTINFSWVSEIYLW